MNKIQELANRFEKRIAQVASAQSGDVEKALSNANLLDPNKVAPLLQNAKVPDDVNVKIDLSINKGLEPTFIVQTTPPSPTQKTLENLLKQQFTAPIKKALTDAKLLVIDPVTAKWLNF